MQKSIKTFNRIIIFVGVLAVLLLTACNDEIIGTDTSYKLNFSRDTLTFDTVFTTVGSATKKLLVYNRNKQAVRISSIALSDGSSSVFRINVDGMKSADNSFTNVEIPAKDSIYIFVEVTVNMQNQNNPVLLSDSILFSTNGNRQAICLEAFGQDVEFLTNKLILNDTTLNAAKPYLVTGYLAIDSAKTLTIPAGCKLYFHNNASLYVYGNLNVEGTFQNPVVMQGDRLDAINFDKPVPYKYVAGQWGGVYLPWSRGVHTIKHLNLSSGYVGLYVNNQDNLHLPSLDIENCKISNFIYYGLFLRNANVQVGNSEISNTGSCTVYLNGGTHRFIQSTIVNYYNNSDGAPTSRDKAPAVLFNEFVNYERNAPMLAEFTNTVIMGTMENELSIASTFPDKFNATFVNCFIRKTDTLATTATLYEHTTWYNKKDSVIFKYPKYDYVKGKYFNFVPDSLSPLRGLANKTIASQYPLDLNGKSRMYDDEPDAGAYEWYPVVDN